MEEDKNHLSQSDKRIDLTDMADVVGQVAVAPRVAAVAPRVAAVDAVVPSEEYMDDVMSITSQSRGGSVVADAPEDEEVRKHFAFIAYVYILIQCSTGTQTAS
jgi:hypothetical protein